MKAGRKIWFLIKKKTVYCIDTFFSGASLAGLSAGVYMGTGELGGVFDCSFRVQWWDFRRQLPPLDLSSTNPWVAEDEGKWKFRS